MDAIRAAHEKLMAASQAFSQKLYESGGSRRERRRHSAPVRPAAAGGDGGDDDIVDAEIVDEA